MKIVVQYYFSFNSDDEHRTQNDQTRETYAAHALSKAKTCRLMPLVEHKYPNWLKKQSLVVIAYKDCTQSNLQGKHSSKPGF